MAANKSKLDPYTSKAQNDNLTPMDKIKGLKDIIRSTETAMFTTRSANGSFHSRAMNPVAPESDTDLTLTFIANHASSKFDEIENDSHVNVSFLNPATSDWASFSGKAKVIEDRDKIKQRWSKSASAWFGDLKDGVHKGDVNDERVALIQVIPEEIRYWHATKGKIGTALEAGIDAMTGGVTVPGELRTITSDENVEEGPNWNARGLLAFPTEILSTIFEWSKSMTDEEQFRRGPRSVSEITLSHICSLLRDVALSTPSLWTSIHIDAASSSLGRVTEYVKRSGACPLDLRIELVEADMRSAERELDPVFDLVVGHSLRWRSLSAECLRERSDRPIIARIGDSPAKALQHLSLDVEDVEQADASAIDREIGFPHIFKEGTPNLKFVRLRGLAIQLFRPPLDAVTTLHLEQTRRVPIALSTFQAIVTRSSSLAHLSVHGDIIGNTPWPRDNNAIHLPGLVSLRICGESGNIYSGLLLGIRAPLLESLTLKDVQEHDLDPLWDSASPAQFINLRQLVFTNFELSSSTYKRLLDTFQEVTSFSAVRSSISESPLVKALMRETPWESDSRHMPWPNLTILAFSLGDEESDEEAIQELLEMREEQGLPLPKIRLRVDAEEMPEENFEDDNDRIELFFQDETWPPNSNYVDDDDVLFSL